MIRIIILTKNIKIKTWVSEVALDKGQYRARATRRGNAPAVLIAIKPHEKHFLRRGCFRLLVGRASWNIGNMTTIA
jgi:hypothetical protein